MTPPVSETAAWTEQREAEVRARLDAATPGPWTYKAEARRFDDSVHPDGREYSYLVRDGTTPRP